MKYDVIIVGGGPGGAIAARRCAEGGLKTLLLEKKGFNREKPCAGGLTKKVLDRFGIPEEVVERSYSGITFGYENDCFTIDDKDRIGVFVCRGKFDSKLVDLAEDAGAEVKDRTSVIDLTLRDGFVTGVKAKASDETECIDSDIVIGADGQSSVVRRKLNSFVQNPSRISVWYLHQMKLSNELIDERIGDRFEMYLGGEIPKTQYAWIFPKNDMVTVGIGAMLSEIREDKVQLKDCLNRFINTHPIASKKLDGAKIIMSQGGRITCLGTSRSTCFNGALLVGEAAGQAMISSGEGIYYAMAGGEIGGKWAIKSASAGDFSREFLSGYEEACKAEIGPDLKRSVEVQEMAARSQGSARRIFNMIKENPRMRQFVLDMLLKGSWGLF
ncbi:MAG: NAD(P)/FAD-dependent oxidoreductase [Halobacteriota archaeon]|nr:NAD(P)/FAD-dependent oxidoreductase [Halobacteriota archaeon]